jgi:hypothetical protein
MKYMVLYEASREKIQWGYNMRTWGHGIGPSNPINVEKFYSNTLSP